MYSPLDCVKLPLWQPEQTSAAEITLFFSIVPESPRQTAARERSTPSFSPLPATNNRFLLPSHSSPAQPAEKLEPCGSALPACFPVASATAEQQTGPVVTENISCIQLDYTIEKAREEEIHKEKESTRSWRQCRQREACPGCNRKYTRRC